MVARLSMEYYYAANNYDEFMSVAKESLQYNPPKKIYQHVMMLYTGGRIKSNAKRKPSKNITNQSNDSANEITNEESQKVASSEKIEAWMKMMLKKEKQSRKVWLQCTEYWLWKKDEEKAYEVLQLALKCLSKHKHIRLLCKYGQYLYENSMKEKGRTIYESLLANNSKKSDIWQIFIDQEIKWSKVNEAGEEASGIDAEEERIIELFQRVIKQKWNLKTMKFWYKRYMDYAIKQNNSELLDSIKEDMKTYVESFDE